MYYVTLIVWFSLYGQTVVGNYSTPDKCMEAGKMWKLLQPSGMSYGFACIPAPDRAL